MARTTCEEKRLHGLRHDANVWMRRGVERNEHVRIGFDDSVYGGRGVSNRELEGEHWISCVEVLKGPRKKVRHGPFDCA